MSCQRKLSSEWSETANMSHEIVNISSNRGSIDAAVVYTKRRIAGWQLEANLEALQLPAPQSPRRGQSNGAD